MITLKGVTRLGMFGLFDIHWIYSNIQRVLGDIPYPQFAERICGYPWILRMLRQSTITRDEQAKSRMSPLAPILKWIKITSNPFD
jgi:hypothetical protein